MTYNRFKAYAKERLAENPDVENADFEAVNLICSVCGINASSYLAKRCTELTEEEYAELESRLERRIAGEPLQYIIGEWDFFGLRMFCGKGCLIPRAETELLAAKAIELIPHGGHFIDLCTGSGCVSVAVLNNRHDITGTAVDISEQALEYAVRNAKYHRVSDRLDIVCRDIHDYCTPFKADVIISNPPYVKSSDVDNFGKSMLYEPRIAFDGGADGLDFYRLILERYTEQLSDGGYFLFEAGYDTAEETADMMKKRGLKVELVRDIHGIDRVCIGKKRG